MRVLRPVLLLTLLWLVPTVEAGTPSCGIGVSGCCTLDLDCNDGDACTGIEVCETATGTCQAGTSVVCDDGNACTTATCVPATGICSFVVVPEGTPCDDLDACTQVDSCMSGICTGSDRTICNDDNACTSDACLPGSGACSFLPVADDSGCDDGNLCTLADTCQSGTCTSGAPLVCDDQVPCTDDRCDAGSCVFAPVDDRCGDGDCLDGLCQPAAPDADADGCTLSPSHESEACADDGTACTDDVCASGLCIHVPEDAHCMTSEDVCLRASCSPSAPGANADGCLAVPVGMDGDVCTEDLDPCTRDVCRTGTCVHEDVPDPDSCAPVRAPFRQAIALSAFAEAIEDEVAGLTLDDTRRFALLDLLQQLQTGLDAVAAELNGADPAADSAQERARAAFVLVKPLPRIAKRLFRVLRGLRRRGFLPATVADLLTRSADDLRLGVRELKRDIRRMRRELRTFVR